MERGRMEGGEMDRGREEILAGYVTYLYYAFPSSVGRRGLGGEGEESSTTCTVVYSECNLIPKEKSSWR